MDQEKKILSFLKRCQNGSSEAPNIAKYLGFFSAKDVLPLLRQMKFEGKLTKTGYKWQVSQSGSAPSGSNISDTEVVLPASSANQPQALPSTPTGHPHTDRTLATARRSSLHAQSGRLPDETASSIMSCC